MWDLDNWITGGLIAITGICGLFLVYVMFVITPVSMVAEATCLKKGYPKANVTWNLDVYCLNLDGAVTTKVEKQ
jgi:hypothetical protein